MRTIAPGHNVACHAWQPPLLAGSLALPPCLLCSMPFCWYVYADAHAEARNKPYEHMKADAKLPEVSTMKRIVRLCRIGLPRGYGTEHWSFMVVALAGSITLQTWTQIHTHVNAGYMLTALMSLDRKRFQFLAVQGIGIAVLRTVMWEVMWFYQREIGRKFARKVLHNMMDHIGANNTFYQLSGMDIDGLHGRGSGDAIAGADIDQRVADDVHGLFGGGSNTWGNGDLLALVINGVQPTFEVAWFLTLILRRVGWKWPLGLIAYFYACGWIMKLLMPDYRTLSRRSSELDSQYKAVHARLKTCAESIAFFDGGSREMQLTDQKFDALQKHDWKLRIIEFKFGIIRDFFERKIPDVLQSSLTFSFAYSFGGTDAQMLADGGEHFNTNVQFLSNAMGVVMGNLGALIQLSERWARIAGRVGRIAELQEVIDRVEVCTGGRKQSCTSHS
eukprot:SAG11_NODE_163_length_13928_cov_29.869188_7_plen_446_part_00